MKRLREFLRSLETDDRRRIGFALHVFVTTGTGDVKRLKDREGQLRLRVGDWCVRLQQLEGEAIDVLAVTRRDKAYKDQAAKTQKGEENPIKGRSPSTSSTSERVTTVNSG